MKLSANNFLYTIKQIVTGNNRDNNAKSNDGGFKVDRPLSLDTLVNPTTQSPVITDSTGGTPSATFAAITAGAAYAQADMVAVKNAISEIALILNAQAKASSTVNSGKQQAYAVPAGTNPTVGLFSLPIPRDYDEASDSLIIRLAVSLANADAGITLTGTPTVQATGAAAVTGTLVTATLPFLTTAVNLSTTVQMIELKFSGTGLQRDNVLSVALALAGTTTGNTNILAIEMHYDSCLVSYRETDSTTNTNSSTGNPLR